jgi:hypothetical protein
MSQTAKNTQTSEQISESFVIEKGGLTARITLGAMSFSDSNVKNCQAEVESVMAEVGAEAALHVNSKLPAA